MASVASATEKKFAQVLRVNVFLTTFLRMVERLSFTPFFNLLDSDGQPPSVVFGLLSIVLVLH